MKTLIYALGILIAMLLTNLTFGEESDSSRVVKKIIKTIEINDDGKTTIDTIVYENNEIDVLMNNDFDFITKGMHHKKGAKKHAMKQWADDHEMEYNITVETDGDSSKVIVMKCPRGFEREMNCNRDFYRNQKAFKFNNNDFPAMQQRRENKRLYQSNTIDLNDTDIISFEKEETKNGNEKITIIRKK